MILVDLNVVLDVVQARQPHYAASAAVIDLVVRRRLQGYLPSHAFTTIHYLVRRYRNATVAATTIDWLLHHFEVATVDRMVLDRACALRWSDFEDAVVSASAENSGCHVIVTRNVQDFRASQVPAVTPDEYLTTAQ